MHINEKLVALRACMKREKIDAYYIPTNDFHGSEYIGEFFKTREFISGFTGSAGTVIITDSEAALWTDGRYFIQAEKELEGTEFVLYKSGQEGVPSPEEYLNQKLSKDQILGFDGGTVTVAWCNKMQGNHTLREDVDLVGEVWKERPELSFYPIWELSLEYAGTTREEKLNRVREWMDKEKYDYYLLTSLDDIAWLLNLRGNDIPCNPVFLAYLLVTPEEVRMYAGRAAVNQELETKLKNDGIVVKQYKEVEEDLQSVPENARIAYDIRVVNARLASHLSKGVTKLAVVNPMVSWKAVKNQVEQDNIRKAHIKDGVAIVRFLCWLDEAMERNCFLTEISVSEKLEEFRCQEESYLEPSFDPISAFGAHGAIVHYSATEESDIPLEEGNFLLMDTGGQYLEGTTDITRTIFLGENPDQEQKKYYTAVLRGNLNLAGAKFQKGCSGVSLDVLARKPLWDLGCDFNHGTGHGVGYLLNVHESPNAFRYRILKTPGGNITLAPGMLTSDEPGFYLEGKFGIRLENLILCVEKEKNQYGQFLGFDTVTLVPFDKKAIDPSQMTMQEIALLDRYHKTVFEQISPFLSEKEVLWLKKACAPLL